MGEKEREGRERERKIEIEIERDRLRQTDRKGQRDILLRGVDRN